MTEKGRTIKKFMAQFVTFYKLISINPSSLLTPRVVVMNAQVALALSCHTDR